MISTWAKMFHKTIPNDPPQRNITAVPELGQTWHSPDCVPTTIIGFPNGEPAFIHFGGYESPWGDHRHHLVGDPGCRFPNRFYA